VYREVGAPLPIAYSRDKKRIIIRIINKEEVVALKEQTREEIIGRI